MSIHTDIDAAVKALVAAAVPGAEVDGFDGREAIPDRLGAGGRIVIEDGDGGEPEITLSPLTYCYDRAIGLVVTAPDATTLDAILAAIGAAIEGDRFLGGRAEFLDATAPVIQPEGLAGAPVQLAATATVVASYSTPHPL